MSHELEEFDGVAAFVGREPGWHRLGTVDKDLTYAGAMTTAFLNDWNVRAIPFTALLGEDHDGNVPLREFITVDGLDNQVVVRDNPATGKTEALSYVGGTYTATQNEQAFAVAPELEKLGATVITAGSIRGGRQVFMMLDRSSGFVIDPEGAADRVQSLLALRSSHDGSVANEACSTLTRIQCANTFDVVSDDKTKRAIKVRHTPKAEERLAQAQAAFLMANGHVERFADLANRLYRVPMTNAEFIDLVTDIYQEPESKRGQTLWEKKVDLLGDLFSGGGDVQTTTDNIAGTAWAGFNALTERIDWHRKARGGDGSSIDIAQAGFVPAVTTERQLMLDRVRAWAEAKAPNVMA